MKKCHISKRSCPTPRLIKRRINKSKDQKKQSIRHHFKSHSPFIGGSKVIINNFDITSDKKRVFIDLEKGLIQRKKSHGKGDGSREKIK